MRACEIPGGDGLEMAPFHGDYLGVGLAHEGLAEHVYAVF
jgi:hypothetical protein